jgi:hypothetical protein
MTEAEWATWATSTDPMPMLEFLRGKVSDRKLLLFAAACFRRLRRLIPDERQIRGIELLEQMAKGTAMPAAKRAVTSGAHHALPPANYVVGEAPADDPHYVALMLYRALASSTRATSVVGHALQATAGLADGAAEQRGQTCLIREILGNPFRPSTISPSLLSCNDDAVRRIAGGIDKDGAFDRLPFLADALEDAGCTDDDLLTHCRRLGPHVQGCWAVDLILGKK